MEASSKRQTQRRNLMAREWFFVGTSAMDAQDCAMDAQDCAIMNRAVRHLIDQGNPETRELLIQVRSAYVPGMSAQDVIDAINDAHFLNIKSRSSVKP
jgi:hypothetical protein